MKNDKIVSYDEKAHSFGKLSLAIGWGATLVFPLILIFAFKIPVNWNFVLKGAMSILILMIPVGLSEFLSIAPMIGPSAMYIMVLTGNFTNLKIPSSIAAMEAVGLDPANYTDESDVISTLAMAVSAIVSILIIAIGVIAIAPLSVFLENPKLAPAFANIVPALFGALGVSMIAKHIKLAIVPFILGIVLLWTGFVPSALVLPILVLAGVGSARLMYKKNWIRG
ncbi:MAG: hypothetical protein ACQGQO_10375 [Sphaerochaetaceae bacterium]|jgi:hypothetical protein